jgi:hypothetical protein
MSSDQVTVTLGGELTPGLIRPLKDAPFRWNRVSSAIAGSAAAVSVCRAARPDGRLPPSPPQR